LGLETAAELGRRESGLAVVVVPRTDGTGQASVVNAGVLAHPVTEEPVVAFVARGGARKLVRLRLRPHLTIVFRSGWDWLAVEGTVELYGPTDHPVGFDLADLPQLLSTVYATAVGGTPEDWREMEGEISAEGHTAVLVRPERIYSNPNDAGPHGMHSG
jgi:hypothetical protein